MGKYTLGQVIDKLQIGEVAIKVEGAFGETCYIEGHENLMSGIYYDEYDRGILKSLEGGKLAVVKTPPDVDEDSYVIMPREAYERIIVRDN